MMKTKKKNQKPIDLDIHLKYRCPNNNCKYDHWLSLKEASTKNFKVVCDCGEIFKVKLVSGVSVIYATAPEPITQQKPQTIPVDILEKCCKLLINYGFTESESKKMIESTYQQNPSDDCKELIKLALKNIGELNNEY